MQAGEAAGLDGGDKGIALKNITGRRIRFALAGCGRIWKNHVDALKQRAEDAEIVAVCDPDPQALEAGSRVAGAPGYARYEEFIEKSGADVVVLSTPSGLHAEQTIAAAAAGKHVVTEKPMATLWEDAQRMVAACEAAGVRPFVGQPNPRDSPPPPLQRASEQPRLRRSHP